MWHGRARERANDVKQLVRRPQPRELIGWNLGGLAAIYRERRRWQVDVRHVGRNLALGIEQLGQLGESFVRNFDHADIDRHAAEATGFSLAPGERVEDRRLARAGKADYRDLHETSVADARVDEIEQWLAFAEALEVLAKQPDAPIENSAT